MTYVVLGCRTIIAGVFLVSLISKVSGARAYHAFVAATAALLAVRTRSARLLAPLTVAGECAVIATLALPGWVRVGFILAIALLCCLTAALVAALHRGIRTPCRCFGATKAPVGGHQVARNLALIAFAATGLATDLVASEQDYELAGIAIVTVVAAACVLITARLDDLVALLGPPRARPSNR